MTHARARAVFVLAVTAAIVFSACSSSSKSSSSTTTTPSTEAATSTTPTSAAGPAQALTITPDTGLKDGQTVQLKGTGYTKAGEQLQVIECADKGAQTGQGDCDIRNIKAPLTADASGNVSTTFVVRKGPFGSNNIVCSAAQKCLLSMTTAGAQNPDQLAVLDIEFAS